ncbi:chemotaxis protein CheB [Chitinophaga sp.]|uniref:chemotaxis protein CheB n=1 Tax=Chitinophaga sp. TaxID=1869181 RepID=UPI002F9325D7
MTIPHKYSILLIGGSAGSMPVLVALLSRLPSPFMIPVVIILHRLKNVESDLDKLLSVQQTITEPEDKEAILPGKIYLAPQNYHLLIEEDATFSLDNTEPVNYSRPAIDLSFSTAASVFGAGAVGILLSGANKDGAAGLCRVMAAGGTGIVQDPKTAEFDIMPQAAIDLCANVQSMAINDIIHYLRNISIANKS